VPNRFANQIMRPRPRIGHGALRQLIFALQLVVAVPALVAAADPAAAMRQRFIGAEGLPTETAYLQAHGVWPAPGSESIEWRAVFKLAYHTSDLARLADAEVLHADCYFIRTRKYIATRRVEPVWDGRVYAANDRLTVGAYTRSYGERVAGYVDADSGLVRPEPADSAIETPDLAGVRYNPFTGQLWRSKPGGAIEKEQRFYLPLPLVDSHGERVRPEFRIEHAGGGKYSLVITDNGHDVTLATCTLGDASAATRTEGYFPGLGPGCTMITDQPTTILELPGTIAADALDVHGAQLVLVANAPSSTASISAEQAAAEPSAHRPAVRIDGRFDEWRSLPGVPDPQGDIVSYLQYNPDADLLEFKVASDKEHLYFYTRVAGRHGRTAPGRDRYYFYIYIDADRNATTGYSPTRDDDCYYGVTLGDDCEAQFEFVGGRFVKTFFGFTGLTTEKDVLAGKLVLGPSWYSRNDERGRLRDAYKVEYIRRAGVISITEDFTEGTSDDITIALSPDGSECEMRAALSGFLRDAQGKPVIAARQSIDLAAGVEASGGAAGNTAWGADSTAVVYGYEIGK
jgi:hypothetical protein